MPWTTLCIRNVKIRRKFVLHDSPICLCFLFSFQTWCSVSDQTEQKYAKMYVFTQFCLQFVIQTFFSFVLAAQTFFSLIQTFFSLSVILQFSTNFLQFCTNFLQFHRKTFSFNHYVQFVCETFFSLYVKLKFLYKLSSVCRNFLQFV